MLSGVGYLEVACWHLVPKFVVSNQAEAVGFFRAKKSSARLPSEGKYSRFSHVVDLGNLKIPEYYVKLGHFQEKFIGHFSPK